MSSRGRALAELVRVFGWLGATAFGGPSAHVALMEHEVVGKRGWLTRAELLELFAAANLIPGPSSTELAMHVGRKRAGILGLIVAGLAFIVPASLIVGALAWAYVRWGAVPAVTGALWGMKPVVVAVVGHALWGLGKTALKDALRVAVAIAAVAALLVPVDPLLVLVGAGALVAARHLRSATSFAPVLALAPASADAPTLWGLGLAFLKIGALLFGSGYVLFGFLQHELVEQRHWLTEPQLVDAIAIGQVTPGPLFTTATFIGYLLGGVVGAVVATVAIFTPAFVFVGISGPIVAAIRRSPVASSFLDGVVVASLALMAVVTGQLARDALIDPGAIAIGAVAALVLIRYRGAASWLILVGAALGIATH
ncbi:MAG: chromate efflux transporter [Deltaproteobacteria bacterium]|nr:chromate efflux transporter [Deltaproteobacteria bacterium]